MSKENSLYDIIRTGTEEEAKKAYDELITNATRNAVAPIIARNLSHPLGKWVKKLKERM